MTKKILGLGLTALVLLVPAAQARTTIIAPAGSKTPYQRWVDESKIPTPSITLTIIESGCPSSEDFAWACTQQGSFTIWVGAEGRDRWTFYHELGHNFDYYVLSVWARTRFQRITNTLTLPWQFEGTDPAERFAETYAHCAERGVNSIGDPNLAIRGEGMGGMRNKEVRRLCRMVANVGRGQ